MFRAIDALLLSENDLSRLTALSLDLGINFGHYDFMRDKRGELVFLELNTTGQSMAIDPDGKLGLIDSVVRSINEISHRHRSRVNV